MIIYFWSGLVTCVDCFLCVLLSLCGDSGEYWVYLWLMYVVKINKLLSVCIGENLTLFSDLLRITFHTVYSSVIPGNVYRELYQPWLFLKARIVKWQGRPTRSDDFILSYCHVTAIYMSVLVRQSLLWSSSLGTLATNYITSNSTASVIFGNDDSNRRSTW